MAMAMAELAPVEATFAIPSGVHAETVTQVEHYTDRLFRIRTTRPQSLRFRSGEFVMIGLPGGDKPVYRAYSIASPNWDEELEFYSIKVPGGPLTEYLQRVVVGDTILIRKKPTGTLVTDALLPGQRLWMFSTGTGIAPFASLIRDPETWEKFPEIILTHTCRDVAELKYAQQLVAEVKSDPLCAEFANGLRIFFSTTRQQSAFTGRITDLMASGELFSRLGVVPLSPDKDRAMICGSKQMLHDVRHLLELAGLQEGANSRPGSFIFERAFVD